MSDGTDANLYGGQKIAVKKCWYAGTDAIAAGYHFCYDIAATVGATDPKLERGRVVTKPATANLMHYAGYATKACQGPCWVDIAMPKRGDMASVRCKINATVSTTLLGCVNAEWHLGTYSDSTVNLAFVGVAAETADTSSTAANKLVQFK